jgi:hypothetical protein
VLLTTTGLGDLTLRSRLLVLPSEEDACTATRTTCESLRGLRVLGGIDVPWDLAVVSGRSDGSGASFTFSSSIPFAQAATVRAQCSIWRLFSGEAIAGSAKIFGRLYTISSS